MLQQMLDCIGDPEIGIIGIYGMGGVGKTTMAKQLNNHFEKEFARGVRIPFEIVIMVTVSATLDIRSIQTSIGKRLGLQDKRRDALFKALRKKKFLLILDDVWCEFKLEDVGIPHPVQHDKGSKIIVISRNQDTCSDMDATKTIKVKPLSNAESWELFVKKAGVHVAVDHIKCFAEKIVKRCKGLPLAIVTVARAMANRRGVEVWENALREMKHLRGMVQKVFVPLKFSFDSLENDMLRRLFLYCACFPEDYNVEVDKMSNYWVGEGLVDKLGSLIAAKNKGVDLIESLKIACMLEDGERKGSVRMHDVMREFALWITSSSSESDGSTKFLIRTDKSVKEVPQALEWVDATTVSLFYTQIDELPELRETCQKLTTLLLRVNYGICTIPPTNFFQHMYHLRVLDLSRSALKSLPDSLSCLGNLKVLTLWGCTRLKALPALGKLRQLQVLDLYGSDELDQQILGGSEWVEGVSNLRYLDVEYSTVTIPEGVISRLHKLEELRLYRAGNIKWRVSCAHEEEERERRSIDVRELSHLRSLSICFKDIIISDWFKPLGKKFTKLDLTKCRVVKESNALQALNESQNLKDITIEDCPGVTCVRIAPGETILIMCEDLEVLLDAVEVYHHHQYSFINRTLELRKLPKLKRICSGLAPLNCFVQLSDIYIRQCNSLKMIFTKEMPRMFYNLDRLDVEGCERMEVIIEEANIQEEEEVIISPFPRLTYLALTDLPTLHDVCTNHILRCPLLEQVYVRECPRLKKDPLRIRNADGLLVIEGSSWYKGYKVMEEGIQPS
ncbi:disease resistance protein RPS2-like [Macadamia integrifolia]|uniref:disease resistance protein RPS2-like n=1 Tax=Macadamia integrifolia TaxID=60698 RepID=UPI001C52F374|nr:disease resistance protein RPS2-like [Macadamia integrifolia]